MTTADRIPRDHRDNRFWTGESGAGNPVRSGDARRSHPDVTAAIAAYPGRLRKTLYRLRRSGQSTRPRCRRNGIRQRLNHLLTVNGRNALRNLRTINGDFCNVSSVDFS